MAPSKPWHWSPLPSVQLAITNVSAGAPLDGFMIQFNKNSLGLAPTSQHVALDPGGGCSLCELSFGLREGGLWCLAVWQQACSAEVAPSSPSPPLARPLPFAPPQCCLAPPPRRVCP